MNENNTTTNTLGLIDKVLLHQELANITRSLEKISEKSWWWDVAVPLGTAIAVAVLTYLLTKKIQKFTDQQAKKRYEENQLLELENRKRKSINQLLLTAESCYASLLTIRSMYVPYLHSDIRERIFNVEYMLVVPLEPIDLSFLSELIFLTPHSIAEDKKWSQVTRIQKVLKNFNLVMYLWKERNELYFEFMGTLDELGDRKPRDELRVEVFDLLPTNFFMKLFLATERCISMTREVSKDLIDLIANFDEAYKPKLNQDVPKHLLDQVIKINDEVLELRKESFSEEILPEFTYLRSVSNNNDWYLATIRGAVSRYDYSKYGMRPQGTE